MNSTTLGASMLLLLSIASFGCASSVRSDADAGPDGVTMHDASARDVAVDVICDGGMTVPPSIVGTYVVMPIACGAWDPAIPNLGFVTIDACGAAWTNVPDGPHSIGSIRVDGTSFVYDSPEGIQRERFAFRVTPLETQRGGGPVLLLESVTDTVAWRAWAVRNPVTGNEPEVSAPHIEACAVQESWATYAFDGASAGAMLASGDDAITPDATTPRIRVGGDGAFASFLQLSRTNLRWPTGRDEYEARIVDWHGEGGRARYDYGFSACDELDADIELEWDFTTLVAHIDWLVIDEHDLNHDGSTTDRLLRRSRIEFRSGGCAP